MPKKPIKRVETGFGTQWERLRRAVQEKDRESLQAECIKLANCENEGGWAGLTALQVLAGRRA